MRHSFVIVSLKRGEESLTHYLDVRVVWLRQTRSPDTVNNCSARHFEQPIDYDAGLEMGWKEDSQNVRVILKKENFGSRVKAKPLASSVGAV